MPAHITVKQLYDRHRKTLNLEHVSGSNGEDRFIKFEDSQLAEDREPDVSYVGHLNYIHPHRIQILGLQEHDYLSSLNSEERIVALSKLYEGNPLCIIIASNIEVPDDFRSLSESTGIPLYHSKRGSQLLVNNLQYFLTGFFANRLTLHGVFLEVNGIGVLLTGGSGVGKSELALELISRGHRLIADDAPEFARIAPDTLSGTCPPTIKHFLEVRGLGILNIQAMFGDSAIKDIKYLRLIVHLEKMTDEEIHDIDRLRGSHQKRNLLGVEIEQVTLPVAPGRNLAVLVEIAVRNHILALKGYNAAEEFIARQAEFVNKQNNNK